MRRPRLETGLVEVYAGNGKGKTTCAMGLALRAAGHGFLVYVIQFMKGSSYTGELYSSQRLYPNLQIVQFGRSCPYASLIKAGIAKCSGCGQCFAKGKSRIEDSEIAALAYEHAREIILSDEYDIVILDEINNAIGYNLVTVEQVLDLIKNKPQKMELVLTGRYFPPQEIIDAADLVTEMKQIKHPYEKGINSRRGIEY